MDYSKTIFIGKVKGAPNIVERNGRKTATFTLTIKDRVPGASGQWTDRFMDVLIFTTDDKKVGVVEGWVKSNQELLVDCQYMSWEGSDGKTQHGFKINTVGLGYTPKDKEPVGDSGASQFPM